MGTLTDPKPALVPVFCRSDGKLSYARRILRETDIRNAYDLLKYQAILTV